MANRKKAHEMWKMRDGREIPVSSMEDNHLVNAIKMVARNCNKESYLGDMRENPLFKKLVGEARKRKFQIYILNTPITIDGRKEYVDVLIPHPQSHISPRILDTGWDSRLIE